MDISLSDFGVSAFGKTDSRTYFNVTWGKKMQAIRFYGRHDLRLEEIPAPPAPGAGQVLVKPSYCGICGTDLHEYDQGPTWTSENKNPYSGAALPQILGHEFSARVVDVGPGVSAVSVGDRVSVQPQIGPRTDYFGQRNLSYLSPQAAVVGLSWPWGGFAELAIVNEYNLVRMPDGISDQQGALVEPAAVGVHALDRAAVPPGGTLLITGAGTIGAVVALAARCSGLSKIFVSEPNAQRRFAMQGLGINAILLDPTTSDIGAEIREMTLENLGVDAAIECSGNGRALQTCIDAVRPQGVVVQVGLMTSKVELEPFRWTVKDLTIRGSLNYPLTIWPRIFSMMESGLFPVEKIVGGVVGMKDTKEQGFDALLRPNSDKLKILVEMPS